MYERFFGLRDQPFRLTPDPKYLFLGSKHREGYAHLLYALNEGSGFVAITGEVGTGKTTLVRALLNENHENISVAYIFNPVLSPIELLQTINAEFGILSRSTSKKELTDALNAFLLAQKEIGGRAVIIVDEAQNLDPLVLEQLRLLSNLETETDKLLQIVLLGQPELRALLDRPELRQLSQRVALRWQLEPLSRPETHRYVDHRVQVAGGRPGLFDTRAIDVIHDHTGGLPRLINILAHRALLVSYTKGGQIVGPAEVSMAAVELEQGKVPLRTRQQASGWAYKAIAVAAVAVAAAVVAFLLVAPLGEDTRIDSVAEAKPGIDKKEKKQKARDGQAREGASADDPVKGKNAAAEQNPPAVGEAEVAEAPEPPAMAASAFAAQPDDPEVIAFGQHLERSSAYETASGAMSRLIELWTGAPLAPTEIASGSLDLQLLGARRGLRYLAAEMSPELLQLIDLPAVVELELPDSGEVRYVLLERLGADNAEVRLDKPATVRSAAIATYWTGRTHLLWRDSERLSRALIPGADGPAVSKLQLLLTEAGTYKGAVNGTYDAATQAAVRDFQAEQGLVANGVAGIVTQIVLYNSLPRFERPSLKADAKDRGAQQGAS